jgi:hypothetical protein
MVPSFALEHTTYVTRLTDMQEALLDYGGNTG